MPHGQTGLPTVAPCKLLHTQRHDSHISRQAQSTKSMPPHLCCPWCPCEHAVSSMIIGVAHVLDVVPTGAGVLLSFILNTGKDTLTVGEQFAPEHFVLCALSWKVAVLLINAHCKQACTQHTLTQNACHTHIDHLHSLHTAHGQARLLPNQGAVMGAGPATAVHFGPLAPGKTMLGPIRHTGVAWSLLRVWVSCCAAVSGCA